MAWTIALSKISFPLADNNFSFQPLIFLTIRLTRNWKQSVLSNPTFAGKPKYLSLRASVITFSGVHICSLISTFMLGLEKARIFNTTNCPDATQYESSTDFRAFALYWLSFIRINESSAKRRFVIVGASQWTFTLEIFSFSSTCVSKAFNPSVHNKNR